MSLSTFLGVETALRGLLAQQRALNTTAHNIATLNSSHRWHESLVSSCAYERDLPWPGQCRLHFHQVNMQPVSVPKRGSRAFARCPLPEMFQVRRE